MKRFLMMNESSTFGYDEGEQASSLQPQPQPASPGGLPGPYKFSQDELRVLNECNQESFFQRSLPLGMTMGFGTYYAVQNGHLKPNPRLGAYPKVTLAVILGYFIGKLSYQQACAEKLMNLPGSYIGQLLREKRDGKIGGGGRTIAPKQMPTMFGVNPNDIYSDAGPGSSLDLDTDRPLFNDDTYRPGSENIPPNQPESGPPRPGLTYDELRKRNRGEYSEAKQDPYRMDQAPLISRRPSPPPPPSASTNKYGDIME